MTLDRRMLLGVASVAGIAAVARTAQAGSLNPPAGPVTPTMKPLDQIEPRTPVQSLAGDNSNQYVIGQSGSYYLTGNITGLSGLSGIFVSAANVIIDLNGFSLFGVAGSAHAIVGGNAADGLSIRNGTISGWGGMGLNLANTTAQSRIEFLNVAHCLLGGISAGQRGFVSSCAVNACGGFGIVTQSSARIVQCIVAATTGTGNGITCDYGSVIQDCSCTENGGSGFVTNGLGVLVTGCKATFNLMDGVLINSPVAEIVDTVATRNTLNGIHSTAANGRIDRCSAIQNFQNGIQVDTVSGSTAILRCTSSNNFGTDYSIAAGNRPAQVASWGSVAGGFGATDAVANIR
jgi:hypothetical protein